MRKKMKKWLSCMMTVAMLMTAVNLPADVLAGDFDDGVEITVEDENEEDVPDVVLDGDEEENSDFTDEETDVSEEPEVISEIEDDISAESDEEQSFSDYSDEVVVDENEVEVVGTSQAEAIVNVARAEVGVSGRPNKYTRWYGKINGTYSYEWCQTFVSWCAEQAGVADKLPKTAGCKYGVSWFQNRGQWKTRSSGYVPSAGDIIYFDRKGDGTASHVGIVTGSGNGRVYTIEGNAKDAVKVNGGYSNGYAMNNSLILGYGVPGYSNPIPTPDPTPSPIPIPQGSQTISDGEYHIVTALDSSKALDVYGASTDNTANIQIYSNLSDSRETFHVTYLGNGAYKIINSNSGRCLDVDAAGMEAGTNVQQYDYVGADQQQWIIQEDNGWFNIISKKNGLYLDVQGGDSSNEANVRVWNGNGSDAQRWRFVAWGKNVGQTVSDGRYHIVSAVDEAKKGLDILNASKDSGANVQIYDNLNDDSQAFDLSYLGDGYYKIINVNSGKSLDVQSADTKAGSNIQQYDYTGVNQQQWIIKESSGGWFNIISKHNGLCLDVQGGWAENGRNVQGWICNDSDAQKWRFIACGNVVGQTVSDGEYHVVSALDESQGLDVENCSKNDGANIQLYPNTSDSRETFRVSYLGDGYYKIINTYSGKSLDVAGGETRNGTNLQQYGYNGVNQQQWIIRKTTDGYFKIISKASGLCVDVKNGVAANNANVWLWTENETRAQKWKFIPVKKEIGKCSISLPNDSYSYDGKAKTPEITVKDDKNVLSKDHDYTVEYSNNINAGTATVTIIGIGNYTGRITKEFKINKASQELIVSVGNKNLSIGETTQIKADGQGKITYKSSSEDKATVSSAGVVTGKQAGEVTVTVTAAGDENYNSATKELVINVLKNCAGNKHVWDNGKITRQATCTEAGEKIYTCTICETIKKESIAKINHKEVKDAAVPATCESEGKTEGSHCSICGTILKKQETIPALGHTWDKGKVTKEATCTADGEKTYTCTLCQKTRTESIAKTGHKEVKDAAVPATCEREGKTEGSHCSVCGAILKKQETIPALGHAWDKGKVTKEATCTADGEKTYTCTLCQKTKTEAIEKTGHVEITKFVKKATCEMEGYTGDVYCKNCGELLEEGKVTEPLSHDWEQTGSVTKATCTTAGKRNYSCTRCHKSRTETILATGHKWNSWKKISDATVSKKEKQRRTCSLCGTSQTRDYGNKLRSVMRVSSRDILLKTRQSTNVLTVSGMAKGDYVSRVVSGNNGLVRVTKATRDGKIQLAAQNRTGSTKITIQLAGGAVTRINVKVQKGTVKTTAVKVSFTRATLKAGTTKKVSVTVNPSTSQEKVTYTSSNRNIATVSSNGTITARRRGTAKITVKSGSKKQVVTITVK